MSIPVLQPRVFYGYKAGIKGNAAFITDSEVIYPAAGVIILQNFAQQRQRYIRLPEKQKVLNIICVSPSKKFVAIAEKAEKPTISIYDLSTLKRKRVLYPPAEPATSSREFVALAFSGDGRMLMAVLGDPDWMLYAYGWERAKLESSTKANNVNNPNGVITHVACNPTDATVVCLIGPGIFRLIAYQENAWRQFGFQKAETFPLTCVTWLNFDRLLLGTQDGRLLFMEGGDLKGVYKAAEVCILNFKAKDENLATYSDPSLTSNEPLVVFNSEMNEIVSFQRGFAYSCGTGTVIVFEKESNNKYVKRNVFRVHNEVHLDRPPDEMNAIQTLCINPIQDTLLATTLLPKLYTVRLWASEMTHGSSDIPFKILGESLPNGPINGLAMCAWKPIFVTTGQFDRTVRVWNYVNETQDLVKQYQESINCVSLHPTGLYLLIGFVDKLRFLVLSLDDIQLVREFNVRNCCACSFSASGHYFVALNGTVIQLYSTVTFEILNTFKGHNGRVTSLRWCLGDKQLVSCGVDGAVYVWEIDTGARVGENVLKTLKYLDCAVVPDARFTYAIADDREVKEISDSLITRTTTLSDAGLTSMVLSRSGHMLFVGCNNGSVLSVKFPFTYPPELIEFNMHNQAITKMCLSFNDNSLVTASEDGSLCIWKLAHTDGKAIKMDKDFKYSTEVLISVQDLQEKIRMLKDLNMRLRELEAEHSYQMRQSEAQHQQKMKELHESFYEALKELKDKNENMENEHATEMTTVNNDINKMKAGHEKTIQTLETTYNAKLILEYDKFTMLENKLQRVREELIRQLEDLEERKDAEIKGLNDKYKLDMKDKNVQLDELREETLHQSKEHEDIKVQIEDDTDREIIQMRARYELELCEEREMNTRLRGEASIMKKKLVAATKEVDEYKHTVQVLNVEHQKFQTMIHSLERDVGDLKKEIVERDNTISDKEKRIYELKKKNQELEKYKFVLNYKINELKSQLEPKDREIKDKKDQIVDMEMELENLQKTNTTLELQINELREKLNAAEVENTRERQKNRESTAVLRKIRIDLHNAAGVIQDIKKLKDSVKTMYHTYSQDKDFLATRGGDEDVQKEFMRQRIHLEQSVAGLKRQLAKQMTSKTGTESRLLDENCELIEEVNLLRKELKRCVRQISQMESILGLNGKYMAPTAARELLSFAVKTKEEFQAEGLRKVKDCEKTIIVLKEELKRLVSKLPEAEQTMYQRKLDKEIADAEYISNRQKYGKGDAGKRRESNETDD